MPPGDNHIRVPIQHPPAPPASSSGSGDGVDVITIAASVSPGARAAWLDLSGPYATASVRRNGISPDGALSEMAKDSARRLPPQEFLNREELSARSLIEMLHSWADSGKLLCRKSL